MFNTAYDVKEYKETLDNIWKGSGHNLGSVKGRLEKDFTNGCDRSYDDSCVVYHFKTFSVVLSSCEYYFVTRL